MTKRWRPGAHPDWVCFEACEQCGVAAQEPCRTPKGNMATVSHSLRKFHLHAALDEVIASIRHVMTERGNK